MDTEEAGLLAGSLRALFADGTADVPARLTEFGWDDVVAEDAVSATTLLFTEKGRALSPAALLDEVVLGALARDAGLPGVAGLVCYPHPASGFRPSATASAVTGLLLRRPRPDERIVIPVALNDGGTGLAVGRAGEFAVTPLPSLDDSLGWHAVAGPARGLRYEKRDEGQGWAAAAAAAHRALAAEIIGVTSRVLDLAIEHTSSRRQFGAPIAAFQAVRHRLADGYAALEASRSLLDASFGAGADSAGVAAIAAKASAGRAHQVASAGAVQVCGAMGATLEHSLHRYVNRGAVLDGLLGSGADLAVELGSTVRAAVNSTGQLPLVVEV